MHLREGLRRLAVVLCACWFALALTAPGVRAVTPDEMLADPKLEARARAISAGLRCVICQNQSIDESSAEIAKDLRLLVREKIKEGASDEQVVDYVVARYGEFVLLKPRFGAHTLVLWLTPLVILLAGIALARGVMRRSRQPAAAALNQPLSEAEKAELARILGDRDDKRT